MGSRVHFIEVDWRSSLRNSPLATVDEGRLDSSGNVNSFANQHAAGVGERRRERVQRKGRRRSGPVVERPHVAKVKGGVATSDAEESEMRGGADPVTIPPWKSSGFAPFALGFLQCPDCVVPDFLAAFPGRSVGKVRAPGDEECAAADAGERACDADLVRQVRQSFPVIGEVRGGEFRCLETGEENERGDASDQPWHGAIDP